MYNHKLLSNTEFENQFQSMTLDPILFTHEAHLRLAWIHINKYGLEMAIENITIQIRNYVEKLGVKDKYNLTLTIAAIKTVNHFYNKSESDHFNNFIKEFPRLKHSFRELLGCHYGIDIFNSDLAKNKYLEPDLLPFS